MADENTPNASTGANGAGGESKNNGASSHGGEPRKNQTQRRGGPSYKEIVQAILQVDGVNVNARTMTGLTPLHFSTYDTSSNAVLVTQALLEAGADPNAAGDGRETPLFWAARESHIRVVEALLDGGASPAVRSNVLDTPLHIACFWARLDIVKLLIRRQQGSECLPLKNHWGETPLDRLGRNQNRGELKDSIGQHILQAYAGALAQRDGLRCLHSVLQDAAFAGFADDGNEFELPVGKLNTEHL